MGSFITIEHCRGYILHDWCASVVSWSTLRVPVPVPVPVSQRQNIYLMEQQRTIAHLSFKSRRNFAVYTHRS